jgi:hypothetical protein
MTAQIPDMVRYEGTDWSLAGIDGTGLFDPTAHDLQPVMLHTACWRGYVCTYAVEDARLRLAHLTIGLEGGERALDAGGRWTRLPALRREWSGQGVAWEMDFEGLDIAFTGSLLLGDGFIRELYVHMGFHPAWKYERVVRLALRDGVVTDAVDESGAYARLREQRRRAPLGPGPEADRGRVARWVGETFERSIERRERADDDG